MIVDERGRVSYGARPAPSLCCISAASGGRRASSQAARAQANLPAGAGAWAASVVAEQLRALACPDDLLTLFAELGGLLAGGPGGLGAPGGQQAADPASALGLFLRRRVLTFESLQFEARPDAPGPAGRRCAGRGRRAFGRACRVPCCAWPGMPCVSASPLGAAGVRERSCPVCAEIAPAPPRMPRVQPRRGRPRQAVCRLFMDLRAYTEAAQLGGGYARTAAAARARAAAGRLGSQSGSGAPQDAGALAALLHGALDAVPREAGRGPPGAASALVADVRAAAPALPQARALACAAAAAGARVCLAGAIVAARPPLGCCIICLECAPASRPRSAGWLRINAVLLVALYLPLYPACAASVCTMQCAPTAVVLSLSSHSAAG